MADFKGGRGKKTGYETQMYRIPTPLRPIVESLGLQFRLLWDGITDPRGEKLISRIEQAIPDVERLTVSKLNKLISGNDEVGKRCWNIYESVAEKDWKFVKSYASASEADKEIAWRRKNNKERNALNDYGIVSVNYEVKEELIIPFTTNLISGNSEVAISDIKYRQAIEEVEELRSQLADTKNAHAIATEDANRWNQLATDRLAEIAKWRRLEKDGADQLAEEVRNGIKASDILKEALKLKAGNGGAIKERIREALKLIDDI